MSEWASFSEHRTKLTTEWDDHAEAIFTYLTDGEHMVDWSSVVIAVRTAPSGSMQGGTTLRITTQLLGGVFSLYLNPLSVSC